MRDASHHRAVEHRVGVPPDGLRAPRRRMDGLPAREVVLRSRVPTDRSPLWRRQRRRMERMRRAPTCASLVPERRLTKLLGDVRKVAEARRDYDLRGLVGSPDSSWRPNPPSLRSTEETAACSRDGTLLFLEPSPVRDEDIQRDRNAVFSEWSAGLSTEVLEREARGGMADVRGEPLGFQEHAPRHVFRPGAHRRPEDPEADPRAFKWAASARPYGPAPITTTSTRLIRISAARMARGRLRPRRGTRRLRRLQVASLIDRDSHRRRAESIH